MHRLIIMETFEAAPVDKTAMLTMLKSITITDLIFHETEQAVDKDGLPTFEFLEFGDVWSLELSDGRMVWINVWAEDVYVDCYDEAQDRYMMTVEEMDAFIRAMSPRERLARTMALRISIE